jgi:hypothetical protein
LLPCCDFNCHELETLVTVSSAIASFVGVKAQADWAVLINRTPSALIYWYEPLQGVRQFQLRNPCRHRDESGKHNGDNVTSCIQCYFDRLPPVN